jgi:integrase
MVIRNANIEPGTQALPNWSLMMSIYLRGSVYWIEIRKPNGERIRETAGTGDRGTAQAFHDLRVKQIEDGLIKPPTWADAIRRWMEERSDKRSLDRDESMARWLAPHWDQRLFNSITDDDVKRVVELKRKETSASNANHYLKFVKSLFNRSVDWGWVDSSPVKAKPFSAPKTRVRFLAEDELVRLMRELPHHLRVMAEFSVLTGLRMSNVTGLRWDRIDMQRRVLWIPSTDYKSGRDHGIPLGDRAAQILEGEKGQNEEWVFTYKGYPVQNTNTAAWQKALQRAGIRDFRWHDLRHTFASYHAMNGTPLLTLKALGGWQTLEMVNRYAHLSAEGARQYANNSVPTAVGACGRTVGIVGQQNPQ